MKKYEYENYDEYVSVQKNGYKKKSNKIQVKEKNIDLICKHIEKYTDGKAGLCHGTRTGTEQNYFSKYLKSNKVIGTEIAEKRTEKTVKWDFNKLNPEWIKKFNFVYSNSFHHAFDPEKTFNVWLDQTKENGILIIEHCSDDEASTKLDPCGVTKEELIEKITGWGGNVLEVVDLPDLSRTPERNGRRYIVAIFVKRK